MKATRLKFLALAATLALVAAGCKHKGEPAVTKLPNSGLTGTAPEAGNAGALPPGGSAPEAMGGGALANFDPDQMAQDRATLAPQTVYFDFDSATIKPSEQSKIQAVASALQSDSEAKLLIEGNCDERGTEEYNRALGERRALAAREALAGDGIDAARIATRSYGEDRPADPGHTPAAWAKNRRDEFVLLHAK